MSQLINRNHVINVQNFSVFVKMMCEKRKLFKAEQIFKEMCGRCSLVHVDSYVPEGPRCSIAEIVRVRMRGN